MRAAYARRGEWLSSVEAGGRPRLCVNVNRCRGRGCTQAAPERHSNSGDESRLGPPWASRNILRLLPRCIVSYPALPAASPCPQPRGSFAASSAASHVEVPFVLTAMDDAHPWFLGTLP